MKPWRSVPTVGLRKAEQGAETERGEGEVCQLGALHQDEGDDPGA